MPCCSSSPCSPSVSSLLPILFTPFISSHQVSISLIVPPIYFFPCSNNFSLPFSHLFSTLWIKVKSVFSPSLSPAPGSSCIRPRLAAGGDLQTLPGDPLHTPAVPLHTLLQSPHHGGDRCSSRHARVSRLKMLKVCFLEVCSWIGLRRLCSLK